MPLHGAEEAKCTAVYCRPACAKRLCMSLFALAPRSRICLALAMLATVAALLCCKKTGVESNVDAGPTKRLSLTPEQKTMVLAKVGTRTILLGDFAELLESMDEFDRLRYQSPERRKELLNELVNVELLAQEAEAKGYDKDPDTQQEVRMVLRDALLREMHKADVAPADIPLSEARAYFDAHVAEYTDPERRRVSAIVLRDEPMAKTVLSKALKAKTAVEWGALVRQFSTDAQAKGDVPADLAGDIGLVSAPGQDRGANPRVPEAVRAAAFSCSKPEEIADHVVAADEKFYVVRLTQVQPAHARGFEEAKRSIVVKLASDRALAKEKELLAALKGKLKVSIDEAELGKVRIDEAAAASLPGLQPASAAPHTHAPQKP